MICTEEYVIFESKEDLLKNCECRVNSCGQRQFFVNGYEINRYDIDTAPVTYPLALELNGCQPQNFTIYYYDFLKNKSFNQVAEELLKHFDNEILINYQKKFALQKLMPKE